VSTGSQRVVRAWVARDGDEDEIHTNCARQSKLRGLDQTNILFASEGDGQVPSAGRYCMHVAHMHRFIDVLINRVLYTPISKRVEWQLQLAGVIGRCKPSMYTVR